MGSSPGSARTSSCCTRRCPSGPRHADRSPLTVSTGQRLAFVLSYGNSSEPPPARLDAEAALNDLWRQWIGRFNEARTRWPEPVRRSLLTLKSLIHRSTGGLVAAPTTSLPEASHGHKNWDYRYSWLRDSTFGLSALINAGYHDEAQKWRDWLLRAMAGSPDKMHIMYRVDGGRRLPEGTIDHLPGYGSASPVRIGNAASTQVQNDVWGEVLDSLRLAERAGLPALSNATSCRRNSSSIWKPSGRALMPDCGNTEARLGTIPLWPGDGLGWDRLLFAQPCGRAMPIRTCVRAWTPCGDISAKGFAGKPGIPVAALLHRLSFGGEDLDASMLLLPLVGFLPATIHMASTIDVIARELNDGGLIRRTRADGPDAEGAFIACSAGWPIASACAATPGRPRTSSGRAGDPQRPRAALGRIRRRATAPDRQLSAGPEATPPSSTPLLACPVRSCNEAAADRDMTVALRSRQSPVRVGTEPPPQH